MSIALTTTVLAVALGACGGGADTAEPAAPALAADPSVVALLPAPVKERGTLRVAVPDTGAPLGYQENGELRGMDPALGEAVAQVMGLRYEPEMVPFASAIPGLQADRYDIAYGQFYVTAERVQVVDFVTDWRDFSSFIVPSGSQFQPQSLADACGRSIGAMDGSVELQFLNDAQADCTSAGRPQIAISAFPSISAGVLALGSDRVEGVLTGRGAAENAVAQGQPFDIVGEIGGGPTATAVARTADSDQMLAAVQKAYEVLIADGAYRQILDANNTAYGAIDDPTVYTRGASLPTYQ
ncbi:transporter substrate-binding domain-containing protein [Pseudonocardia nematodicida]|uniref:Transporter substrate-binding domain-containing protein n=1 Tax=Pseudonocardia nematodicida TaxID=1206997 RepID=A0ABV1KG77_9PSEU